MKIYDVIDGVEWVNGQKVPENRKIELSDAEAFYDKSMGRIVEQKPAIPEKQTKSTDKSGKKSA